jgi:hypothetical protein
LENEFHCNSICASLLGAFFFALNATQSDGVQKSEKWRLIGALLIALGWLPALLFFLWHLFYKGN